MVVEPLPVGARVGIGPEHVVVHEEVVVARVLEPLHEHHQLVGIDPRELRLREHGSEVHAVSSVRGAPDAYRDAPHAFRRRYSVHVTGLRRQKRLVVRMVS